MENKEKNKSMKLIDVFPKTLDYHISKIMESAENPNVFSFWLINLKIVFDCIEGFKNELLKQEKWNVYNSIIHHYELIEYPLEKLKEYFSNSSSMNGKDAFIFIYFVHEQLKELQEIAKELDEKSELN